MPRGRKYPQELIERGVRLAIESGRLLGIDNTEIIQAVHQRPEPMIPAGRQLTPGR